MYKLLAPFSSQIKLKKCLTAFKKDFITLINSINKNIHTRTKETSISLISDVQRSLSCLFPSKGNCRGFFYDEGAYIHNFRTHCIMCVHNMYLGYKGQTICMHIIYRYFTRTLIGCFASRADKVNYTIKVTVYPSASLTLKLSLNGPTFSIS